MKASCFGGEIKSNNELFDVLFCKFVNDIFLEGDSNFFLYTRALLMLLLFDVAFLFSIGIQPNLTLSSAMHFSYMGLKHYYYAYEDLMFSLIFFSIY